jgi:IMP dehydrogenase
MFILEDLMQKFSSTNKFVPMGLTFEDVKLVDDLQSTVTPESVSVTTSLTPTLKLNIPLLSAAMDTVTEARFATAFS